MKRKKSIARNWATFVCDIPDPGVETEDGMDFVEFPGRDTATAIADILQQLGCEGAELTHLQHLGWELETKYGNEGIRCLVQLGDGVFFTIEDDFRLTFFLRRAPPCDALVDLLQKLDAALKADGRFRDILWFTPKGFGKDQPGAPFPVGDWTGPTTVPVAGR